MILSLKSPIHGISVIGQHWLLNPTVFLYVRTISNLFLAGIYILIYYIILYAHNYFSSWSWNRWNFLFATKNVTAQHGTWVHNLRIGLLFTTERVINAVCVQKQPAGSIGSDYWGLQLQGFKAETARECTCVWFKWNAYSVQATIGLIAWWQLVKL